VKAKRAAAVAVKIPHRFVDAFMFALLVCRGQVERVPTVFGRMVGLGVARLSLDPPYKG
jgi:hypothetical protein